ncbi:MAG: ANTAR domain-containing response regulator [Acidimicrobiales bacterium]
MTRPRVVVAEDEALIRLDLKECLVEEGYEVVGEAADGAQAVAMVRDNNADVAILDVMMPGVDGLTAAREIMADRLAAVVILTAYSQRDLVEQARDAGAMAYLIKPFQREELVPAIELAVARFREMEILAREAESLSDRLEARKVIDRAKGRLQDGHQMTEQASFRFLQQTAMSRRTSMRNVAQAVLDGELTPD